MIILKAFTWFCAALFLYAMFAMVSLRYQYTLDMPQVPQTEAGRVCPVSVFYSKTVYVTKAEEERLSARFYYIFGAGVLAILAEFARRVAVAAGVGEGRKTGSG